MPFKSNYFSKTSWSNEAQLSYTASLHFSLGHISGAAIYHCNYLKQAPRIPDTTFKNVTRLQTDRHSTLCYDVIKLSLLKNMMGCSFWHFFSLLWDFIFGIFKLLSI